MDKETLTTLLRDRNTELDQLRAKLAEAQASLAVYQPTHIALADWLVEHRPDVAWQTDGKTLAEQIIGILDTMSREREEFLEIIGDVQDPEITIRDMLMSVLSTYDNRRPSVTIARRRRDRSVDEWGNSLDVNPITDDE